MCHMSPRSSFSGYEKPQLSRGCEIHRPSVIKHPTTTSHTHTHTNCINLVTDWPKPLNLMLNTKKETQCIMAKEENIIYTIYYSLKCLAVIPVVMYFFTDNNIVCARNAAQ